MSEAERPLDSPTRMLQGWRQASRWMRVRIDAIPLPVQLVCLQLPLLYTVFDDCDGDVPGYEHVARQLLSGGRPYIDFTFEYPALALPWFVLPALIGSGRLFRAAFCLQLLAVDTFVKGLLLRGRDEQAESRWLTLHVVTLCQAYFYLKRLDCLAVLPWLLSLICLSRGHVRRAGGLLALGASIKLLPALAVLPAFFAVGWSRRSKFVAGLLGGALPLLLAALWLPWWTFAAFHARRGLQCESLVGAALWLGHFRGLNVQWVRAFSGMDIAGEAAQLALPWVRRSMWLLFGGTLAVVLRRSWHLWMKRPTAEDCEHPGCSKGTWWAEETALGGGALLLAFLVGSHVLSPQFMVQLAPLLVFARLRWFTRVALWMVLILTAALFPAPGYGDVGIDLTRTVMLNLRNVMLVVSWVCVLREVLDRPLKLMPSGAAGHGSEQ